MRLVQSDGLSLIKKITSAHLESMVRYINIVNIQHCVPPPPLIHPETSTMWTTGSASLYYGYLGRETAQNIGHQEICFLTSLHLKGLSQWTF